MCQNNCQCGSKPAINHPAPDFTGSAFYNGSIDHKVSLADFRGKWVLLFFYPLDFTFICPTELFQLGEMQSDFEKHNCQVLSVSVDSVFSHKSWAEADKRVAHLGFPMIADLTRKISKAYGVLHEGGMSLRGSFLIDPDGVLQSMTVNNLPVGRNIKEHLRLLKAFQTGDLCPVNWEHGQETLGKA